MKQRFGFVSNSSSSSFVCAISKEEGTYYTDDPKHSPIKQCFKCDSKMLKEFVPNNDGHIMIEPEYCPICRILTVFERNNINSEWDADKVERIVQTIENLKVD